MESKHKSTVQDNKSINDKKPTPKFSQDDQLYERGGKQKIRKSNRFEDKKFEDKKQDFKKALVLIKIKSVNKLIKRKSLLLL